MAITYKKTTNGHLEISETQGAKKTTYSYDRVLNEIQATQERLDYWKNLKIEADKLELKR